MALEGLTAADLPARTRDYRRNIAGRAAVRGSAGRAGCPRLCQQLVRLAVSVSWPRDRDLHLDEPFASGRALDLDPTSERLDSIPQPVQSGPSVGVRAAHTVIANRKTEHVVVDTERDPHARGVRVLRRVGERLRDRVVGGYFDMVQEPLLEAHVELDADGRAAPECFQRR